MSQFKIHILSNDEFDSLPHLATRGSDVSDSLGFANKFTDNAFVRQTGVPELNKFLINHEVEELMASTSTHEDANGIRHKKFNQFLKQTLFPLAIDFGLTALTQGSVAGAGLDRERQQGLGLISRFTERSTRPKPQPTQIQGLSTFGSLARPESTGVSASRGGRARGTLNLGTLNTGLNAGSQILNPLQDNQLLDPTRFGRGAGQNVRF